MVMPLCICPVPSPELRGLLANVDAVEFRGSFGEEYRTSGLLEIKQAGWFGSGQTTRPVTNSTG